MIDGARWSVTFLLSLSLLIGAHCSFLGIPKYREYTAAQARRVVDDAFESTLLIVSLIGSEDERSASRLVFNFIVQAELVRASARFEDGKVYRKEPVDECAGRIRSLGALLGAATAPEAIGLPVTGCEIKAE